MEPRKPASGMLGSQSAMAGAFKPSGGADRSRLKALVRALPDQIYYVHENLRLSTIFGGRPGETQDISLTAETISPELAKLLPDAVAAARKTTTSVTAEFREGAPPNQRVMEARVTATADREVLLIVRDITESQRSQAEQMLRDRLVSLGQVTASVAHEINNPLTYILLNLNLLADELGAMPPSVALESLQTTVKRTMEGAEQVAAIVRDLRTFSQGQQHKMADVDLHTCLNAAFNVGGAYVRRRARFEKAYGSPPLVRASEAKLIQVFLNLLTNAADARRVNSSSPHRITARTGTLDNGDAFAEVCDNGCGIDEQLLERIFEPFVSGKGEGGTGLGLWLSQEIIQSMGGRIEVRSEPDRGTTFRVCLPAALGAASQPVPSSRPRGGHAGRRVLIADDNVEIVRSLRRAMAPHEVVVASDGEGLLAALRASQDFDAILCDMLMPGMSGMEIVAEVERLYPELVPRLVLMTGASFNGPIRSFLETTSHRCLYKPFPPAVLKATLRDLFENASLD